MKSLNSIKKTSHFSIIDIGSSSIRLVIYDSLSVASRTLFNEKIVSNLGIIVNEKKKIDDDAFKFLIEVLERFIGITISTGSDIPKIIATAAFRKAENKEIIVKKVFEKFNIKLKILTEEEEGELSALGTIYSQKKVDGLVGDLGGGSLELTEVINSENLIFMSSIPLGYSYLRHQGKLFSSQLDKFINKNLEKNTKRKFNNFYAVGGSFRGIARLYMFIKGIKLKIIQDYVVPSSEIILVIKQNLFKKGNIQAEILSKVTKSRRNSLPYALHVLENLINYFSIKDIYFSSSSIREGYIKKMISKKKKVNNPFLFQIQRLSNSTIKTKMSENLFKWIKNSTTKIKFNDIILKSACMLTNIAWDVHPEHRRLFAMERILWYPFYGITRNERIELSIIMYFRHSNGIKDNLAQEYYVSLNPKIQIRCKYIGQCLRLAHHITGGKSEKNLDLCSLSVCQDSLILNIENKNPIFSGEAIPRGLRNSANSIKLKKSEIKIKK